jgi:hypothetical protein
MGLRALALAIGVSAAVPAAGQALSFSVTSPVAEGAAATVSVGCGALETSTGTVGVTTAPGTAAKPADFGDPAQATLDVTCVLGIGGASTTVPTVQDALDEDDETFTVAVSGAGAPKTVTITDDDPPPSVSIGDASVVEGQPTTAGRLQVPVTLSAASGREVRLTVTPSRGPDDGPPALPGEDFAAAPVVATVAAGGTTGVAQVPIVGDRLDEGPEKLALTASDPVNATLGTPSTATGTIVDDDVPYVAAGIVDAKEGTGGTTNFVFPVVLTNPSTKPVEADLRTAAATAKAGEDFTAVTATIRFAPGETQKTVTVPVVADATPEPDELFALQVVAVRGGQLPPAGGVGVIRNDDGAAIDPSKAGGGQPGTADPTGASKALRVTKVGGRRGRLTASVTCPAPAGSCSGEVTFFSVPAKRSKVQALRKERRLGLARFKVAGGRSATVTLKVRKADLRLVRQAGAVGVRGYAVGRAADGQVTVRSARGVLRR